MRDSGMSFPLPWLSKKNPPLCCSSATSQAQSVPWSQGMSGLIRQKVEVFVRVLGNGHFLSLSLSGFERETRDVRFWQTTVHRHSDLRV